MEMLSQSSNSLNMTTLQSIRQQILTQTNIKSQEIKYDLEPKQWIEFSTKLKNGIILNQFVEFFQSLEIIFGGIGFGKKYK